MSQMRVFPFFSCRKLLDGFLNFGALYSPANWYWTADRSLNEFINKGVGAALCGGSNDLIYPWMTGNLDEILLLRIGCLAPQQRVTCISHHLVISNALYS
jgi:hypothetical protein